MPATSSRRDFLTTTSALLGGVWLSSHLPEIEALGVAARRAFDEQQNFRNLTPAEARTLSAFAAQIIPSDELPGAREAGAIYFMDAALGGFARPLKPQVQEAAKALDGAARRRNRRVSSFADLTSRQQIRVLRDFEQQDAFDLLRTLAVMGVFADPKYGGNRNQAGFRILDVQHQATYTPPFGYYDAQLLTNAKARQP
jgi:gluconate 2-dehydrogenase gamma chain